jgi:DNA-binding NarL/FixJ family response regulator
MRLSKAMKEESLTPTRVLIVDDVADVRRELSLLLSLSGEVTILGEAADGLDALRQAEALHPEVVLMDLEMPLLDGFQAARRIKDRMPSCRVIALSIHDSEESRERCTQAGIDDFIPKGACVDALLQAITRRRS